MTGIYWTIECFLKQCNIFQFADTNIALNKVATQSATYTDDNAFSWGPELAVDNCTDVQAGTSLCCSASEDGPGINFWQVNLGNTYTIGLLIIYGRADTTSKILYLDYSCNFQL